MNINQAQRKDQSPSARDQLRESAQSGHLFAIVDPSIKIPLELEAAPLQYRDTDPIFFEMIAWDKVHFRSPMLVQVSPWHFDWLAESLPLERWGFFVVSDFNLWTLADHLQKFVIARGPDKNPYFLRFHDPSVIEVLLRTWTTAERNTFLGPLNSLGLPNLENLDIQLWAVPKDSNTHLPEPEDCLLSISNEQLLACAQAIENDLVKIIYWHLRATQSKTIQFLSSATLQSRIAMGLTRARQHNLVSVSDLVGFVSLMFEIAPNFDEHPAVRAALADPAAPPLAKMRFVSTQITEAEWQEVVLNYDRKFWK